MEKTDRELLIKEISTRLPYGVKAQVLGWDEKKGEIEIPLRVYSINTDGYVYFESNDYDVDYVAVDNCLLYLRQMSSMTEKEKEDIKPLFLRVWTDDNKRLLVVRQNKMAEYLNYLYSHHLDFRGLIPMGLALEAPEDMYK